VPDDYPLTVKEHRLDEPEPAEKPWTCTHCYQAHDPFVDCEPRKAWLEALRLEARGGQP
jgi:hypothetical protein